MNDYHLFVAVSLLERYCSGPCIYLSQTFISSLPGVARSKVPFTLTLTFCCSFLNNRYVTPFWFIFSSRHHQQKFALSSFIIMISREKYHARTQHPFSTSTSTPQPYPPILRIDQPADPPPSTTNPFPLKRLNPPNPSSSPFYHPFV